MTALGRLERVDLRTAWTDEARHFTPWLALPENLSVLAETLGYGEDGLELESVERGVGPFRADIVCRDPIDDSRVLIENQLEATDHRHLGQILTYAAGLEAVTLVWVAARFTEEHRAAADWLNGVTSDRFRFFALEVELWRIGDSPPAPRFNVVAKPNAWVRAVARSGAAGEVSELKEQQRRHWEALMAEIARRGSPLGLRKARPQQWQNFSVGRSGFRLAGVQNTQAGWVRAELFVGRATAKTHFEALYQDRDAIERELGFAPVWEPLPDRIGARVSAKLEGVDPTDESDWPRQHAWLIDRLEALRRVFGPRVRTLAPVGEELDDAEMEA